MLDKSSKFLFKKIYYDLVNGYRMFAIADIVNLMNGILDENNVRSALLNLEREGLVELIFTEKKSEPYVFILLAKKGNEYVNEKKVRRKELFFRVLFATVSALVTFVLGRVFYGIFS